MIWDQDLDIAQQPCMWEDLGLVCHDITTTHAIYKNPTNKKERFEWISLMDTLLANVPASIVQELHKAIPAYRSSL